MQMNKLLILLLLIPMVSFGETWVCQSEENDYRRVTYIRDGDSFIWNEVSEEMKFKIVKENENFIIATNIPFFTPNIVSSWALVLDKKKKRQSVATTDQTGTVSFKGDCQVIGVYE